MAQVNETDQEPSYSQFACIGTGFSAIALGATLKRWYGITDICFFERHKQLGGTWFVNKYPDELWAYLNRVATKYSLPRKMSFGVNVERCEWIEERSRWQLHIRHLVTDSVYKHESQFLFCASGQLVTPRDLGVPGVESFKGPIFHASRWRHDIDLTDKNVVVFGNGCTAAQIVPSIAGKTKHLTQIIRSKHWILPPIDQPFPPWFKFFLTWFPGAMLAFRFIIFLAAENELRGFPMTKAGARFRQSRRRMAEAYMRKTAPTKYHDLLVPDFEIGCKRRIFDSGYLESLHANNLTLTNDEAVEILPNGVRTNKDKIIPADVVVLANGYVTNRFLGNIEVVGRQGETIKDHWDRFGGAEAYNCSALSGFPNFFVLLGPNAATGHTSAIMAAENSVNFALRILKPVLDGKSSVVDLKVEAEQRYVDRIQADLQKTVWFSGCKSWYVRDGEDGKKWNAMSYPWSQGHFWYRSVFPTWSDWSFNVGSKYYGTV
ncbi:hypothetical protein ACSS6W_002124 [Trichoderma asperelloides]